MVNGRMRRHERFAGWLCVALLAMALSGCGKSQSVNGKTLDVTIGGRRFHLELALTDKARYHGLSDRKHIAGDGGMLFAFKRGQILQFVMRKCYVPIDLIYLDGNGRVVRTYAMTVQPYDTPEGDLTVYSSVYPADFAIELKGGTLKQLHLELGDQIELPTSKLKARAQ